MSESRLSQGQRLQAAVISAVASPLIGLLCRTLTWKVEGGGHYADILAGGRLPIIAFWHGRILDGLYHFRHRNIVVITSQNFDGEWIARVIRRFGYGTARGSTSRGGSRALVQLRHDLAGGRPVAFTVDGPRGPARVAQAGAVWLAGATGNPLLPFHVEADRHWTIDSWDRTQVPKPFSRMALVIGSPIQVRSTDSLEIGEKRLELEASLRRLEHRSLELLGPSAGTPEWTR